jgi:hypothetical protein
MSMQQILDDKINFYLSVGQYLTLSILSLAN